MLVSSCLVLTTISRITLCVFFFFFCRHQILLVSRSIQPAVTYIRIPSVLTQPWWQLPFDLYMNVYCWVSATYLTFASSRLKHWDLKEQIWLSLFFSCRGPVVSPFLVLTHALQSNSFVLKLASDEEGKGEGKGRYGVWGWYLFYGRCQ